MVKQGETATATASSTRQASSGAARIGDKVPVHKNESIYVPIGTKHRLEIPSKIDVEVIEVRTGNYLGEDDIDGIQDR